jgi:hypothetical protein
VAIEGCAAEAGDPHHAKDTEDSPASPPRPPLPVSDTLQPCCEPIGRLVKANGQASILTQQFIAEQQKKPNKPR